MKKILFLASFLMLGVISLRANDTLVVKSKTTNSVHNILSTQLPSTLLKGIQNEYKGYWITELFETGNRKPSYFITVENADQIIKLTSDDSENWVIASTTIKTV